MKQLLVNGYFAYFPKVGTGPLYNTLSGGGGQGGPAWFGGANDVTKVVSTPGTISNFAIKADGPPGSGDSWTFVLVINGSDTALTVTISDSDTEGQDTSNSVAIVAGDLIRLKGTSTGSPSTRRGTWSAAFEGTNARESMVLGGGLCNKTETRYVPIEHSEKSSGIDETKVYQVIPTGGIIKDLYIDLDTALGTDPEAYRITLRKNGVSTALTVTVTGTAQTGNDTANEITVVAGDLVNIMIEPLNSPANNPNCRCGLTFKADTDGESIILGGSGDKPTLNQTEYNYLRGSPGVEADSGPGELWGTLERNQGSQTGFSLSKLHVWVSTALSGDYVITLRAVGADTALAVTISSGQTGSNTSNSYTIQSLYEYLGISCLGLVTGAHVHWGLVQTVVAVVTTYPSDPSTRVTGLIHRFTSANVKHPLTLEVLLGGATKGSLTVLSLEPPTEPELSDEPDTVIPVPPTPPPPGAETNLEPMEEPIFIGLDVNGNERWLWPNGAIETRPPEEQPRAGGGAGPSIPI